MTEVLGGTFVTLGADVATPGTTVFEPGYKGVDVGAAAVERTILEIWIKWIQFEQKKLCIGIKKVFAKKKTQDH